MYFVDRKKYILRDRGFAMTKKHLDMHLSFYFTIEKKKSATILLQI